MPSKSAAAGTADADVLGGRGDAAMGFRICAARIWTTGGGTNPESHSSCRGRGGVVVHMRAAQNHYYIAYYKEAGFLKPITLPAMMALMPVPSMN